MRFLVDNALSPAVSAGLAGAGHDALHLRDLGLQAAEDEQVFTLAAREQRILVSADTDFGTLLALRQVARPSVILFRHRSPRNPRDQVTLLLAHLDEIAEALLAGSLVSFDELRMRIRPLPLAKRE